MPDHDNAPDAADGPDWARVARAVASGAPFDTSDRLVHDDRARRRETMLAALADTLRADIPEPPTAADVELALAVVMRRRDEPHASMRITPAARRWRPMALAAAAALLVAGALTWQRAGRQDGGDRLVAAHAFAAAMSTGPRQVDSLRLADGSTVVLGPNSALDTATGYSAGRREVQLRGAAAFTVTHDASRPFTVRTYRGVVRDVGTRFVVRSEAPGGMVVAVQSGIVAVRGASPIEQMLSAGDRAVVPMQGATRVERGAGAGADLAFTRGELTFDATPMPEVVETMRRWYGIRLHVDEPALLRARVSASFARESGVDAARIIAAAIGAAVRLSGDTVHLRAAVVPAL
jgi:ferric-dicitrate binding protein FerR (iron transport regulator)